MTIRHWWIKYFYTIKYYLHDTLLNCYYNKNKKTKKVQISFGIDRKVALLCMSTCLKSKLWTIKCPHGLKRVPSK